MLVRKETFRVRGFRLHCGATLPEVAVGYESYGTLSPARDNAILICHYFSGTSHGAGRYAPEEALPGYWDAVIGPGKAFDTARYFVLSADTLCNLNVKDPHVVTTGPATANPATGKPYGMTFPPVVIRDFVEVQRLLLDALGIRRLVAVAGPSMGGLQALEWAIAYPDRVARMISVISVGSLGPWTLMMPGHAATEAIRLDPRWNGGDYYGKAEPTEGLVLALKILSTIARCPSWADATYGRRLADVAAPPESTPAGRFLIEAELDALARMRAALMDANHYLYLALANAAYEPGSGLLPVAEAFRRIRARCLLLPCRSDLFFPPAETSRLAAALGQAGVTVTLGELASDGGHLAGVLEIEKAAETLRAFLAL